MNFNSAKSKIRLSGEKRSRWNGGTIEAGWPIWQKVTVYPPLPECNRVSPVDDHHRVESFPSQRVSVPRSCPGSFYTPAKDCKDTSTQVLKKKEERARSAHSAALQIIPAFGSWGAPFSAKPKKKKKKEKRHASCENARLSFETSLGGRHQRETQANGSRLGEAISNRDGKVGVWSSLSLAESRSRLLPRSIRQQGESVVD